MSNDNGTSPRSEGAQMAKTLASFISKHWQWLLSAICTAGAAALLWSYTLGGFVVETRMEIGGLKQDVAEISAKLDVMFRGQPRNADYPGPHGARPMVAMEQAKQ
jgi:hypothetical protein